MREDQPDDPVSTVVRIILLRATSRLLESLYLASPHGSDIAVRNSGALDHWFFSMKQRRSSMALVVGVEISDSELART
ncbi:hypothetical protein, partial [Nocardia salmonicida]|uniref:hypothetical protein n=1 Tax=Nocardia salmonicida TaxID=53431 RepID=UPI0036616477